MLKLMYSFSIFSSSHDHIYCLCWEQNRIFYSLGHQTNIDGVVFRLYSMFIFNIYFVPNINAFDLGASVLMLSYLQKPNLSGLSFSFSLKGF